MEEKARGGGIRVKAKKAARAERRSERKEARSEGKESSKKQSIKKQFKEKKKAATWNDKQWYKNNARNKGMRMRDYYAKHVK